jgi:PilZ domain
VRSSGRIPKEIPILLIGSDLDGRVFSEPTKTVMLSLHGAGIFSRHKLSAEQELILRWPERNKESEIRVVGHIGSGSGGHTYGVAFFDPHLNFWEIDFPPVSPIERELGLILLVCTSCKTLEKIDDTSIEADVCATNDGVIRSCRRCGTSTVWKPPADAPASEPALAETAQLPLFSPPPNSAPVSPPAPNANPIPIPPPASSPALLPATPTAAPSFYAQPYSPAQASSPAPSQATVYPEPRGAVLTLPSPEKPAFPRLNRRKHPRVRVTYSACIRHADRGEDIVPCEDMSKGGLRFKSRKRYYVQTLIEVAVPYEPSQPAIFVPAQIVFVEELPEQQLYRYGVAYLKPTKPRDFF